MPTTLKDLAVKLHLSVTTVSRALADYDDVSPATRMRVRATAAKMGYVPNITARQLQKQRTDTIGFIIPTFGPRFADPFFSEFLAGVGNTASQHGFDLLVSTRAPGEQEQHAYARMTQGHRVDGLIIVRTRCDDWRIKYLHPIRFPFVSFGRSEADFDFPYVDTDSRAGVRALMDHLIALGHTRIAFIAAPPDLFLARERMIGYQEGLAAHNLPFDETLIVVGDMLQQSGYEQARQLLILPKPPTAIVAGNDLMAFGALSAIQAAGLTVGKDVAVAGFDGTPQSEHTHPPLTTIYQPVYEIGQRVTRMLIGLLSKRQAAEPHILIQPELILRASTLNNTAPVQSHGDLV